jgi:transcriptional regulator with XRE-family HTH domain
VAHPPDTALSRAIRTAFGELRAAGWSTRDIAERLEVSDPTIIRWENGNRLPALDLLPRIDDLCGQPTGYVLRLGGYVSTDHTFEQVVKADQVLNSDERRVILGIYDIARRRATVSAR